MANRILTLFFLFCYSTCYAQKDMEIEQLIRDMPLRHETIAINTQILLPTLHKEGKHDTLKRVLNYTETYCLWVPGDIYAFHIVYSIEQRAFSETIYNNWVDLDFLNFFASDHFRNNPDAKTRLHEYIKKMAASLMTKDNLTEIESLLIEYLATENSKIFHKLKGHKYDNTILKRLYLEEEKNKKISWLDR